MQTADQLFDGSNAHALLCVNDLLLAAKAESCRARVLFPDPSHLTLALAEEAGEVTKAVLDLHAGKGNIEQVDKEIVQCMAMCIRLWEEGDPSIGLMPVKDEIQKIVDAESDI